MKTEVLNHTQNRLPKKFIKNWVVKVARILKKKRILKSQKTLTVVFVSSKESRKLNLQYRKKNKSTDVLSFAPVEEDSLGELVLCWPVLQKQAKEHGLSLQNEIGYMILHGMLHLLGYDHEKSKKEAHRMFTLQDSIFDKLL